MNPRNWLLIKGLAIILVLWLIIGGIIKVAGAMKPTPEKIRAYALKNDITQINDPEERKQILSKMADMMNQMEVEDFQDFESREDDRELRENFMRNLTPEEQWFFMEKRMGKAFSQMMTVFNEMDREERKEMVADALEQIRKNNRKGEGFNDPDMEEVDPEIVEKVTEAGLEAYFRDASAETKIDLAPLLEEVQKVMNGTSGPRRRRPKNRD